MKLSLSYFCEVFGEESKRRTGGLM